jgi:hypothetical protein
MAPFERATLGLFLWWSADGALRDNPCRVLSASRFDVDETAKRIEMNARLRGLTVHERTDHAALAGRAGFRLPPTQSLMVDPTSGADPLRLVVWQARSGMTLVSLDGPAEKPAPPAGAEIAHLLRSLAPAAREYSA